MWYGRRQMVVAGLALALGACASAAEQGLDFIEPRAKETTVTVQNNYWSDMGIYVLKGGGSRWKIGTVMGGATATMRIPRDLLAGPDLQLQAASIGPGAAYTFPRIAITPGTKVDLRLERNLTFSNFMIQAN